MGRNHTDAHARKIAPADGWCGHHHFAQAPAADRAVTGRIARAGGNLLGVQFVEYCRLAGVVQADDNDLPGRGGEGGRGGLSVSAPEWRA